MKNVFKIPKTIFGAFCFFVLLNAFTASAFANTSVGTSVSVLESSPTPTTTSTATAGTTSGSSAACTASKPGSAPTLLSASPGNNSVTLTWSKAAIPVTKYLVAYGTTSDVMQYGNPSVGGANTTFYTVGNLSGGTRYYFKVKAINDCMPGDFSNTLSAAPSGTVITTTGPAEGFAPASQIPSYLFDIALTIDSATLGKSSDLVARTQFTSFGTAPTLVNMVYSIVGSNNKKVYTEKGEVTVETEKTVTKEFKNLNLGNGKYTLVLTTTYGNNVTDEFRQAFEVKGVVITKRISSNTIRIISVPIIAGGFIIFLFIKRKQKKR